MCRHLFHPCLGHLLVSVLKNPILFLTWRFMKQRQHFCFISWAGCYKILSSKYLLFLNQSTSKHNLKFSAAFSLLLFFIKTNKISFFFLSSSYSSCGVVALHPTSSLTYCASTSPPSFLPFPLLGCNGVMPPSNISPTPPPLHSLSNQGQMEAEMEWWREGGLGLVLAVS